MAGRKVQKSSDDKITECGWSDDKITDRQARKALKRLEKSEKAPGERLIDNSMNSNSTFSGASTDDKITAGSNKTRVSKASALIDDKITIGHEFTDDKITENLRTTLSRRDDKITRLREDKNDQAAINNKELFESSEEIVEAEIESDSIKNANTRTKRLKRRLARTKLMAALPAIKKRQQISSSDGNSSSNDESFTEIPEESDANASIEDKSEEKDEERIRIEHLAKNRVEEKRLADLKQQAKTELTNSDDEGNESDNSEHLSPSNEGAGDDFRSDNDDESTDRQQRKKGLHKKQAMLDSVVESLNKLRSLPLTNDNKWRTRALIDILKSSGLVIKEDLKSFGLEDARAAKVLRRTDAAQKSASRKIEAENDGEKEVRGVPTHKSKAYTEGSRNSDHVFNKNMKQAMRDSLLDDNDHSSASQSDCDLDFTQVPSLASRRSARKEQANFDEVLQRGVHGPARDRRYRSDPRSKKSSRSDELQSEYSSDDYSSEEDVLQDPLDKKAKAWSS